MEYYQALTGRQLPISFSDRIQYKVKSGDTRELVFMRNDGAHSAVLKKAGRTLKVEITTGLPKDTDSTPQGLYQRANTGGGGGMARGRGGPQRGGRGGTPQRGGPGPQRGGGPGPQRGGPAQGGPAQGGQPRGGGPGPQRGGPGPQRGGGPGPAQGGQPRGGGQSRGGPGPQRGGPGPQRGGGPGPQRGRGGAPAQGGRPKQTATAQFDYDAQTDDELSFKEGDQINVVTKDPGGWWEGELDGRRGWIPANYVKEN